MLRRDSYDFIDSAINPGKNSAKIAGLVALLDPTVRVRLYHYFAHKGAMVRHPFREPWDNPGNANRENLIPFVAGLSRIHHENYVRDLFWATLKRFFFFQNHERDKVGSEKWRCPHWFDVEEPRWDYASVMPKLKVVEKFKWFDQPDFLWPHHMWHLVVCAKLKWFYWFAPIGWLFLVGAIIKNRVFNFTNDETEIICLCLVAGRPFVWLFKKLNPGFVQSAWKYWVDDLEMNDVYPMLMKALK